MTTSNNLGVIFRQFFNRFDMSGEQKHRPDPADETKIREGQEEDPLISLLGAAMLFSSVYILPEFMSGGLLCALVYFDKDGWVKTKIRTSMQAASKCVIKFVGRGQE